MGQNTLSVDSDKMPDEPSMASSTENRPTSRPETTSEKPFDASEDDIQYPSTGKLILVMLALYLSMFLVALVSPHLTCSKLDSQHWSRTEPS